MVVNDMAESARCLVIRRLQQQDKHNLRIFSEYDNCSLYLYREHHLVVANGVQTSELCMKSAWKGLSFVILRLKKRS
jgi:hypothetical protein